MDEASPVGLSQVDVLALADNREQFLVEYSGFILGCVRRFTADVDERMDMYAHVCARLLADDCRRLRQFRGETGGRECRFTTWLATVTLNLCREWIRTHRGRRRLYRTIERLSATHAEVFKYRYWHGFTVEQILGLLRCEGRGRTRSEVERLVGEVEAQLSPDQRWRVLARQSREESVGARDGHDGPRFQFADAEPRPEAELDGGALVDALRTAVARLPGTTRAVLEMRYRRGWTARRVAERLGIQPYKRVYEIQSRGLAALRDSLVCEGFSPADLEDRIAGKS